MKKLHTYFYTLTFIIFLTFTTPANAATLYFDVPREVGVGNLFEVVVMLDTEEKSLNAIQGTLLFSDELKFIRILDGDSIIPLWVTRPKLEGNTIVFSGIIPGGFDGIAEPFSSQLQPGRVFGILFESQNVGTPFLSFKNIEVFRNAERAELATVNAPPATFSIVPADDVNIPVPDNFSDEHPPEQFFITVARDDDIFNGAHFIVFNAQDKEFGVDYYEVYETDSELKNDTKIQWTKTESPYVLTDQALESFIYVKAVDKAGNTRIAALSPQQTRTQNSFIFILLLLFILGLPVFSLMVGLKRWHKKYTKAQSMRPIR